MGEREGHDLKALLFRHVLIVLYQNLTEEFWFHHPQSTDDDKSAAHKNMEDSDAPEFTCSVKNSIVRNMHYRNIIRMVHSGSSNPCHFVDG